MLIVAFAEIDSDYATYLAKGVPKLLIDKK